MAFLTAQEKAKIRFAIAEAEARTCGEIVTVIAHASDSYRYIPTLWAALLALSIPGLNFLFGTPLDRALTYQAQVLVFIAATWLFQQDALKMRLIPKSVRHRRASLQAREQFFAQGVHTTPDRADILIFVSVAEHYVEIIADEALRAHVSDDAWQEAIDEFIALLKQGDTTAGFLSAINRCREVLWAHFPADRENPNTLPNHLIDV